jgi:hypothetical protein
MYMRIPVNLTNDSGNVTGIPVKEGLNNSPRHGVAGR